MTIPQNILNKLLSYKLDKRKKQEQILFKVLENKTLQESIKELEAEEEL
jgi:hypothetical protein